MATDLAQCIGRASTWLISIQDQSGGWGEYQGAAANSLNTAEAILALLESHEREAGDQIIQAGVQFLESNQLPGKHVAHHHAAVDGSWGRRISTEDGQMHYLPDTVRSAFVLLALNVAGKSCQDKSVSRGLEWLLRTVPSDGGWGYAPGGASQLFPTCMALRVMLRLRRASEAVKATVDEPIRRGLKYLHERHHNEGGSFGRIGELLVPHTLYALRALQLARDEGFQTERHDIDDARSWINQKGPDVTRWFNETIEISKKEGGSYTFTYVTPALYLDTFDGILSAKDPLAQESMIVMHDNMEPVSCGMSGKRPVSWATAKALFGLTAVRNIFPTFPEREIPTAAQVQGRKYLFGFLVLILGAATVVALAGKISSEYAGIITLVVLAGLLIYGFISERSFREAFLALFRFKKKTTSE